MKFKIKKRKIGNAIWKTLTYSLTPVAPRKLFIKPNLYLEENAFKKVITKTVIPTARG
jgi:hypothetical protein